MPGVPTLAQVLAPFSGAEIARKIGRARAFVHRLQHGAAVVDDTIVAPLADAIGMDVATLAFVIQLDARAALT